MNVYNIPISDRKNQRLSVNLGGQNVDIILIMRLNALYIDVYANNKPIVLSRLCLNKTPIINAKYKNFKGELFFEDIISNNNPIYGGLGKRYLLRWVIDNE